jgi:hypothetical protein
LNETELSSSLEKFIAISFYLLGVLIRLVCRRAALFISLSLPGLIFVTYLLVHVKGVRHSTLLFRF